MASLNLWTEFELTLGVGDGQGGLACCGPWGHEGDEGDEVAQSSLTLDSPGKNTGVGYHFLLQGIFPTQELNLGLLHYRQFFTI